MNFRPNLLFIMPDQLRHDFLGCYGADFVSTPHIDRLANEGIRYTRAYSQSPLCVPARAGLLTGRSALGNGVVSNGEWLRPDLDACGIATWPQVLAAAGYDTASIGKMHFYPWDASLGFRYRSICEDKRWIGIEDDYARRLAQHGLRKRAGREHPGYLETKGAITSMVPRELGWDRFVGDEACRYLRSERQTDRPFAMMVGFPGPHCPYDADAGLLAEIDETILPDPLPSVPGDLAVWKARNVAAHRGSWDGIDFSDTTLAQRRRVRAHYAALVRGIDDEVGAILRTLEETGELERTMIIFASDHGDSLGDHELNGKGTFYESSTHIPMIVRRPGGRGRETRNELVELTDVTGTMLAAAGVERPASMNHTRCLPGLNLQEEPRDLIFGCLGNGWMAFDGRWKWMRPEGDRALLFDLQTDPDEQHDRSSDPACAAEARRLDEALSTWIMVSIRDGHQDKRIAVSWADDDFSATGWQRPYPSRFTEYTLGGRV